MYLDHSTSHPSMNQVTTTINKLSVETPIITPLPSPVQNYNPTFLTLQPGQCAMCGQLKSIHPEGCPQFGKVVCSACQRPNHASLFCQRIKKDIKKSLIHQHFPRNATDNIKETGKINQISLINDVNINLKTQIRVKTRKINR